MDLEALQHGNFSSLDTAVSDWDQLIDKLQSLKGRAETELDGKSKKANWAGVNATVTREFITKTAKEFGDAVTQARSIRNIVRDTRDELVSYRGKLRDALARASAQHISVKDLGCGRFEVSAVSGSGDDRPTESAVTSVKEEIQGILDQATESDATAADALRALADQAEYGFANSSYADRDTAATALRAAERAAELAGDPEELSTEEFDELNQILKDHHGDGLFAARFAQRLGPEGTLDFWATINDPRDSGDLGQDRVDRYGELQKNLSLTLAAATQSDSPAMQRWERDMATLGTREIETGSARSHGFQVMSSLMRYGDFDDQFLNAYGNELIKAEKERTHNGDRADLAWHQMMPLCLNRTGEDTGIDPMTGFMRALSRSPEAATEFFTEPYVTADEDHDFEDEDGDKRSVSTFQYLFEEREWLPDIDEDMDESIAGRNYLAHALEAATTGHPFDTPPAVDTLPHTREQADLYQSIVKSVSEDRDRLLDHSYMSDSFGEITAEYMPDINRALSADEYGKERLFPISGAVADMAQSDVTRFLHTVGRSPEGYAAVNLGQHNYTTALMEHHFRHPDAYLADPNFSPADNLKEAIGEIAKNAGEIQGTIGAGRTYEIEENGSERDAAFNNALDNAQTWGSSLAGIGVSLATAPFSGPASIVAGGLAGTAVDEVLGAIFGGSQRDSSDEIIYRNGERWDSMQESTSLLVQQGAESAGELSGNVSPNIISYAGSQTEAGFGAAQDNVHNYLDGQGVPSD